MGLVTGGAGEDVLTMVMRHFLQEGQCSALFSCCIILQRIDLPDVKQQVQRKARTRTGSPPPQAPAPSPIALHARGRGQEALCGPWRVNIMIITITGIFEHLLCAGHHTKHFT